MQVAEFFDATVVVSADAASGIAMGRRLQHQGCRVWLMDLGAGGSWRQPLAEALAHARQRQAAGLLLVLAEPRHDAAFWRSQDRVVEHLASRPWDIVYLGHGAGERAPAADERPSLVHCDLPPEGVGAIALSCHLLQALLDTMPERATDGPLAPGDWLAIASWLAMGQVREASGWAAWPPLLRAAQPPGWPDTVLH